VTGQEIRSRFLDFFRSRDHAELPSTSLIPADDPTTLFISAGMQPLQPYYQGVRQPPAPRLTSCQRCLRTWDLEEVGRTVRHTTFFEMLGNFAPTGAYFKETAIPWAWELVTDPDRGFGLPADRLRVTTHPSDEEARDLWRGTTGVRPEWIYENEENWWGLASGLGPCGPDSEIWWDRGREAGCGQPDCYPDHCDRFLEVWNLVFPQFDRQPDGALKPLPRPAIDTGMGLERIALAVQGTGSVFETDLFAPLVEFVREAASESRARSEGVIADHLRAMTFVIGDGVLPSNEGRGYVLRRLVRRAALHATRVRLGRPLADGVGVVVATMREQYPSLAEREAEIRDAVRAESDAFGRTLERGLEQFERLVAQHGGTIPGDEAFKLHDTFGFPIEMTVELAEERGLTVDRDGFDVAMAAQRERSRRTVSHSWTDLRSLPRSEFVGYTQLEADARVVTMRRAGTEVSEAREGDEIELYLDVTPFYAESGGQIGDLGVATGPDGEVRIDDTKRPLEGVVAHLGRLVVGRLRVGDRVRAAVDGPRRRQIMRHHTATHLLNKALEETLDRANLQRGSWVGPDHTTFDFPLDRPLSKDELARLESRINEQIRAALPLDVRVLPYEEAVATGATHLFDERYSELVRVVCFGGWSCEFCGGTHSPTSADVGPAVILSETSIGQGLRRIDLTVGEAAEGLVRRRLDELTELSQTLGVGADQVPERVGALRRDLREAQRQTERLRDEVRQAQVRGAQGGPTPRQARVPLILEVVDADGMDDLRSWADRYLEALGGSGVVGVANGRSFVLKVSRDLVGDVQADRLAPLLGRGGGRPELAQGKLGESGADGFRAVEEALR
jgi:alanyl-tRNA synthetase